MGSNQLIVNYEWIVSGTICLTLNVAVLLWTCSRGRLQFLMTIETMLIVNYAVNILTGFIENSLDSDGSNTWLIYLYYGLGILGISCYYMSHWLFSWQYWLVSKLMAQEV